MRLRKSSNWIPDMTYHSWPLPQLPAWPSTAAPKHPVPYRSAPPSDEVEKITGELASVGVTLCRAACLNKGLGCEQSLGLTRSGVEMVVSPILCLIRADDPVAGK